MAYVTLTEVQAWLESTKLTLSSFDAELEDIASTLVVGTLAEVYDTTTWTNDTNTPDLVTKVIAMLVAAWTYNRAYSEDDPNGNAYAKWLEDKAYALLAGIKDGSIDLSEVAGFAASSDQPSFWPDDTTASAEEYDYLGNVVVSEGQQDHQFRIGMRW